MIITRDAAIVESGNVWVIQPGEYLPFGESVELMKNRQLDVTLTSAVELDPEFVERVGAEIERQTDRKVQLRSQVDGDLLGGLVLQVGNMVLDASIRNRLERLRKEVAKAA